MPILDLFVILEGYMLYTSAEDDGTNHGEDISANKPRSTASEVYNQIVADLTLLRLTCQLQ